MTTATEVTIQLLRHQHAAVTCHAPRLLMSGAFGSGKSYTLSVKALDHLAHPGNLILLARKKLADLRVTTLRTLIRGDGDVPPVLPEGTYQHNKNERMIRVHGGGELYYTGFDQGERLRSLNLGLALVDQGEEMDEEEFVDVEGRLRNPNAPYRQVAIACNPGPRSHFLHEKFLEGVGTDTDVHGIRWRRKDDGTAAILSSTGDNPFLPDDYHQRFMAMSEQARRRYYDGEWVTFEGLVYDRFDRGIHLHRLQGQQWRRVVVGVDAGYTNPAAFVPIAQLEDGTLHQLEEFHRAGLTEDELAAEALTASKRFHPETWLVDPSAASLIAALRKAGLPVRAANNDVFAGIQRVQIRLTKQKDGRPGLTIEPTCTETVREFEAYSWKDSKAKDEPVKAFDHALDALRYAVAYLDPLVPFEVWVPGQEKPPMPPEEQGKAISKKDMGLEEAAVEEEREREQDEYLSPQNDELFR